MHSGPEVLLEKLKGSLLPLPAYQIQSSRAWIGIRGARVGALWLFV